MGFTGTDRTTRRAVAAAKASYQTGRRRVFRPWIPEPGLWLQWDWDDGPRTPDEERGCGAPGWPGRGSGSCSLLDKTLPTIADCLDATLRQVGGAPTYALTENERTVTTDHIARIPVRNPQIIEIGHHYGLTVHTCVPADPQSKGGSEATVRIAKRDLVPTDVNLREAYRDFAELEDTCPEFTEQVNATVHRAIRRRPVDGLAEERHGRHHPARSRTTRRSRWIRCATRSRTR